MSNRTETIMHMAIKGLVWDGDLISKSDRDELVKVGYVDRHDGWNFLTREGVKVAVALGVVKP